MKRMLSNKNRWLSLIAAVLMLFSIGCPGMQAKAAQTSETGSITIDYPVGGADFSLYKVGTSDGKGGYTLDESFASYDVYLDDSSAAEVLATYAVRDGVAADKTGGTDEDGQLTFTGLEKGVYLIVGRTVENEDGTYIPSAILVELPQLEDGAYVWDVTVHDKYKFTPAEEKPEQTELTVLKVWQNDEEKNRPESITVQLLCDGLPVLDVEDAEVILTKEDNWTYTWEGLSTDHQWTVAEKTVPENYKVYSFNASQTNTICLVNTYEPEEENPEEPKNPDKDQPNSETPGGSTEKTTKLPQTGQLWWPVGLLIAGGLFCILIGLLVNARKED